MPVDLSLVVTVTEVNVEVKVTGATAITHTDPDKRDATGKVE
jgi:hypothetical protein